MGRDSIRVWRLGFFRLLEIGCLETGLRNSLGGVVLGEFWGGVNAVQLRFSKKQTKKQRKKQRGRESLIRPASGKSQSRPKPDGEAEGALILNSPAKGKDAVASALSQLKIGIGKSAAGR